MEDFFSDWIDADPERLPDSKDGPFLVTNNAKARNAHGMPSHVQLVQMLYDARGQVEGPVTAFGAYNRKIWGITHYRPAFYRACRE